MHLILNSYRQVPYVVILAYTIFTDLHLLKNINFLLVPLKEEFTYLVVNCTGKFSGIPKKDVIFPKNKK